MKSEIQPRSEEPASTVCKASVSESLDNTEAEKRLLRKTWKQRRGEIPSELRKLWDGALCETLLASDLMCKADAVLLYAPIGFEIDLMPLFAALRARGILTAFPRCEKADHSMEFHVISDAAQLLPGAYGILEPIAGAPLMIPTKRTVILVPGLVYDTDGYRIGFGGGYYDRYLARFPGIRVGIAYEAFVVPRLARGEYDQCVDVIATEREVHTIHANEKSTALDTASAVLHAAVSAAVHLY